MTELVIYAPLDGWLVMLAEGWRLPIPWGGFLGAYHGQFSVLLVRRP